MAAERMAGDAGADLARFAAVLQKAELALVVEGSHFDMRRRKDHRVFSRVEDPLPWRPCVVSFAAVRVHRGCTGGCPASQRWRLSPPGAGTLRPSPSLPRPGALRRLA